MKVQQIDHTCPPSPFVAVWPGQDITDAIKAHTQATGYRGPFLVQFMVSKPQQSRRPRALRRAGC